MKNAIIVFAVLAVLGCTDRRDITGNESNDAVKKMEGAPSSSKSRRSVIKLLYPAEGVFKATKNQRHKVPRRNT